MVYFMPRVFRVKAACGWRGFFGTAKLANIQCGEVAKIKKSFTQFALIDTNSMTADGRRLGIGLEGKMGREFLTTDEHGLGKAFYANYAN